MRNGFILLLLLLMTNCINQRSVRVDLDSDNLPTIEKIESPEIKSTSTIQPTKTEIPTKIPMQQRLINLVDSYKNNPPNNIEFYNFLTPLKDYSDVGFLNWRLDEIPRPSYINCIEYKCFAGMEAGSYKFGSICILSYSTKEEFVNALSYLIGVGEPLIDRYRNLESAPEYEENYLDDIGEGNGHIFYDLPYDEEANALFFDSEYIMYRCNQLVVLRMFYNPMEIIGPGDCHIEDLLDKLDASIIKEICE